jgi:hypothetical protein
MVSIAPQCFPGVQAHYLVSRTPPAMHSECSAFVKFFLPHSILCMTKCNSPWINLWTKMLSSVRNLSCLMPVAV